MVIWRATALTLVLGNRTVGIGFAAVMRPTVIARQVIYDLKPFNSLVVPNVKLRDIGIRVVRCADEDLDQVATKLLDITFPCQRRAAFAAEAALYIRR